VTKEPGQLRCATACALRAAYNKSEPYVTLAPDRVGALPARPPLEPALDAVACVKRLLSVRGHADNIEAPRPDTAGDARGDTVSPSVSGHKMRQFCRIFNGLFPHYKSPSAPRLLIHFDVRPAMQT
jgi:hypothetical protein